MSLFYFFARICQKCRITLDILKDLCYNASRNNQEERLYMATGTLLSISVSNFGPFAESITFSTQSDMAKKELLCENSFEIKENRYNKVSYIYGANGAGKSNFCKAVMQLQNFLSLSPIFAANNPQMLEMSALKSRFSNLDNPYKFNRIYADKPTHFGIEILLNGITYSYSFDTKGGRILTEKLTKKNKRTEVIMDRTSPLFTDIVLKSELKGFENNISVVKENVLCLSMAAFLNIKLADELLNTINSIKVVNMAAMNLNHVTEEACTEERIKKYLKVLQVADATLQDIHVEFNEKKVERQKMNVPDLEDREFVVRRVQLDVLSTHKVYTEEDNTTEFCELPFMQIESTGTIKLFGILPVIFNALEEGGVLIIDEIENGLHPIVVKQIIDLFLSEDTNPNHAQLVCTSHSKELIESKVRRDQVWIVTKNKRGESSLRRISDIPGMRAYENNGYKYLEAAFSTIPVDIFK